MRRIPTSVRRALQATSGASTLAALIVIGVVLAAFAAPARGAQTSPPIAPPPSFFAPAPVSPAGGLVTRSAHVAFEGCPAKNITLRVSIARTSFLIGQPVPYAVVITNKGATACGPAPTSVPPGRQNLTIGPCGQVSGIVVDASGHNVYPGRVVFHCPVYLGAHLGAHAALTGEGSWIGYEALSAGPLAGTIRWQKAPPGRYHVLVDGAVSVPLQLTAPPTSPAHPSSPIIPSPRTPGTSTLPMPTTPALPPTSNDPTLPTPTTAAG